MLKGQAIIFVAICYQQITNIPASIKETSDLTSENVVRLNYTNCEDFSRYARFNPYSVLETDWFLIYYWATYTPLQTVKFMFPTNVQDEYLHYLLDAHVEKPIDWNARRILMIQKNNFTSLLVEQGDRGQYLAYGVYKGLKPSEKITAVEIVIKQTGDNKLLGMSYCKTNNMYVFAPVNSVPPKRKIQEEVARLGFQGKGGRSYLYQGHQWMPIPEVDDQFTQNPNKHPTKVKSAFINEYLYE